MSQTNKGQAIEDASMRIIDDEIKGRHNYDTAKEWPIVRRVIHATADFDFATTNKIIFHRNAIKDAMQALKNRCNIIIDVNGVIGGLNKQNPKQFENEIICKISDSHIAEIARQKSLTRSQAAMRAVCDEMNGSIVAIGNAPTALREVIKMVRENVTRPALIIGMPVGFVDAAESKHELASSSLLQDKTPFITNIGRKGGSPATSAIINAIYKMIREEEECS